MILLDYNTFVAYYKVQLYHLFNVSNFTSGSFVIYTENRGSVTTGILMTKIIKFSLVNTFTFISLRGRVQFL